MKKRPNITGLCLWILILCTGCAGGDANESAGEFAGGNRGADSSFQTETAPESGSEAEKTQTAELTAEERKQFTDFANRAENNGFLLSQYEHVREAVLNEILYNGAGMESKPLTEEERKEYEEAAFPVETDITRLTTEQIESFLQRRAGIGLADMAEKPDWIYLEKSDSYVFQHGDTNFCAFVCTGGTRTGEVYELRFKAGGDYVSDCIVTLEKNGDEYRFVSNRFFENTDDLKEIRKIREQSFSLELESWGEVEFVSYEPDILENFQQDVTFSLERKGKEAFLLPEVKDGNVRVNDRFDRVDAVAFKDYDQDGYTDILIICTYEQVSGENAGDGHQEVRIYKGGEETFRYMHQLCFALNTEGKNQSISQVLEEIQEEAPDFSSLDQDILRQLEIFAGTKEQWAPRDYDSFVFGYTVCDLDGDGRLELLVQLMAGTGLFSENHFYQVEDSGSGIKELPQERYDGFSELDIGVSGSGGMAFRDEEGTVYYMASDNTRNGYAESFCSEGAYYLKNGCVYSMVYRGLHRQAQREDSWTETCFDAQGNEISREEWEGLLQHFLEGKEETAYPISWISAYPEEVRKASGEEILRGLAECL